MENVVPWLREGVGAKPQDGGCILQVIDWINRGQWTDEPPCVHPVLRRAAISLNDYADDKERQKLLALAPRLMNTAPAEGDLWTYRKMSFAMARNVLLHTIGEREMDTSERYGALFFGETYLGVARENDRDSLLVLWDQSMLSYYGDVYHQSTLAAKEGRARESFAADALTNAIGTLIYSDARVNYLTIRAFEAALSVYEDYDPVFLRGVQQLLVDLLDAYDEWTGRNAYPSLDCSYPALCDVMNVSV